MSEWYFIYFQNRGLKFLRIIRWISLLCSGGHLFQWKSGIALSTYVLYSVCFVRRSPSLIHDKHPMIIMRVRREHSSAPLLTACLCDQSGKNPLEFSATAGDWTGPQRGQTVRFIHSPTELSWPGPWERTDCEIHSFSHWAIMTRATERTDSEIHSFSHWAIMAVIDTMDHYFI